MLFQVIGQKRLANIHIERIMYVKSDNKVSTFHMADSGMIDCRMPLNHINNAFPELIRISDMYLLNERYLRCIDRFYQDATFKLSNGETLRANKSSRLVLSAIKRLSSSSGSGDEKGA